MRKTLLFSSLFVGMARLFAEDGATDAATRDKSSLWQTMIMIAIAIVFFYFILWRPEQKRRKSMEQVRGSLKKGDRVTAMGIVGTIDRVKENTVIVKMVDGAKIEMIKAAISEVKAGEEPVETEKKDIES